MRCRRVLVSLTEEASSRSIMMEENRGPLLRQAQYRPYLREATFVSLTEEASSLSIMMENE